MFQFGETSSEMINIIFQFDVLISFRLQRRNEFSESSALQTKIYIAFTFDSTSFLKAKWRFENDEEEKKQIELVENFLRSHGFVHRIDQFEVFVAEGTGNERESRGDRRSKNYLNCALKLVCFVSLDVGVSNLLCALSLSFRLTVWSYRFWRSSLCRRVDPNWFSNCRIRSSARWKRKRYD